MQPDTAQVKLVTFSTLCTKSTTLNVGMLRSAEEAAYSTFRYIRKTNISVNGFYYFYI